MRLPDHPFIRESWECPLCGADKQSRHIACTGCFEDIWGRGTDDERAEAEERLDAAEDQYVQDNGFNGMGAT